MENKVERVGSQTTAHKEGSIDYMLSDYEGEIKRILYTDVRIVPSGCFGASGSLSAIGSVECRVLYLSADDRLGGVSFSSDYEIPLSPSEEEGGVCSVELLASTVRPVSGRRLQGKYTLAARYATKKEEDLSPSGDAVDEDGAVLLTRKVKVPSVATVRSEEREYAEVLCRRDEEGKYLFSDAQCRTEKITAANGGYIVAGSITVTALAQREGTGVSCEQMKIPFEEFVVAEDMQEGARVCGACHLKSLVLHEEKEEESYVCVASVICHLELFVLKEEECSIVRDLYSTECETSVVYRELSLPTDGAMHRGELALTHKVGRESMETPEMSEILFSFVQMRPTYRAEHGAVTLEAEATVTVLGSHTKEDGTRSFCRHVERIPVKGNAPMAGLSADARLTPVGSATVCNAVFDGENLEITMEHTFSMLTMREQTVRAVASAHCTDRLAPEREEDEVWVLYPDSDLWNMAKRHHLSLEKVCADNSISLENKEADAPEILKGVSCLWIE